MPRTLHPNDTRSSPARCLRRLPFWRALLVGGLYLLIYLALVPTCAHLTLPSGIIPWNPPVGATLALFLLFGVRYAPVALLADQLCTWIIQPPLPWWQGLLISGVTTAGYGLAAHLLRRFGKLDPHLTRLRDVLVLIAGAMLAPLLVVVPIFVVGVLYGLLPARLAWAYLERWWLGDTVGLLTVVPFLLLMGTRMLRLRSVWPWPRLQRHPYVWQHLGWLATVALVIGCNFAGTDASTNLLYLYAIPLVWAALAHGVAGAAGGILLLGLGTLVAVAGNTDGALETCQRFLLVMDASGLLLGVLVDRGRRLAGQVQAHAARLDALIAQAPVGLLSLDSQLTILRVNDLAADFIGREACDLVGRPLREVLDEYLPAAESDEIIAHFRNLLATGTSSSAREWTVPWRHRCEAIYLNWETRAVTESAGTARGLLCTFRNVTGQVAARAAIAASERRYRAIVEEQTDLVMRYRPDGVITFVNPALGAYVGCATDMLLGQDIYAWLRPHAIEASALVTAVTPEAPVATLEELVPTATGDQRWVLWSVRGLFDETGQVVEYQAVGRDIHARKEAAAATARCLEELALLSRTATELVAPLPEEHLYAFIAREVLALDPQALVVVCAYTPAEERLTPRASSGPPEILAEIDRTLGTTVIGLAIPINDEMRQRMVPGQLITLTGGLHELTFGRLPLALCREIEVRAGLVGFYAMPLMRDDALLGTVVLATRTGMDLHNQHLIEAVINQAGVALQRARAEAAFARERAFFSSAIDLLPIPIGFLAADGTIVRANEAYARTYGPVADGHDWRQYLLLQPETRAPLPLEDWPVRHALRGEVVSGRECLFVRRDGHEVPLLMQAAPTIVDGQLVAAVVASQDLTALKEADRAKNEFLAVISHELLTPLTCILGWTEIAQLDPALQAQALEVITRNAQRQRRVVDDLLDISRVIHGKLVFRPEATDLTELATQCIEDYTRLTDAPAVVLQVASGAETLPVHADPVRIRQAIGNLLDNALRHTAADGRITLTLARADAAAVLTVVDTGDGIPPDKLADIFTPFRQVRDIAYTPGLGIGLALVRAIAELHGGTIQAASPGPGHGSTFTLQLPIRDTEPTGARASREH